MKFGETEVVLKKGDITKEEVDIIVNAANCSLSGGGGVDGAIHKAGGPAIMAECKALIAKIKRCPTGDAVITGAGKLKATHVVHAVGPVWAGGKKGEPEDLENAYYNSLVLAKEFGGKSVAFPAISTGAYSYPLADAAKIALRATKDFCSKNSCFSQVRFVLFSPEALSAFESALAEISADSA